MRSSHGFSRRRLLQGLGLGAAAGNLLPILNASGQEKLRPKRLVLIWSPDGIAALNYNTTVDWKPQGTEKDFALHAIHAPLEPFKSKLVLPWGLTLSAGGAGEPHAFGMAGAWTGATLHAPSAGADFDGGNGHRTGWGSSPSIDQIVAKAYGPNMPYQRAATDANPETPYRTVELGVQCQGPTSLNRMIYAGDNAPLTPEVNPLAAFNRLFAGVKSSSGTPVPSAGDPAATQARAEQGALVDWLKNDLGRLRTRVGSEDYNKVDAHLEGLLSIERRLNASATQRPVVASCTVPTAPAAGADFPTQVHQMIDVATAALACDVTRVVSLQMSYAFSQVVHKWLGHTSGHHTMSHDGTDRRKELQQIDTWYAGNVAYLLQKLDAVNEGTGTMLDNTLVVWGRELGSTQHRMERVPLVMAGSAGGALPTGRWLNLDGQPHAKLLVSIAQLMGLNINSVGDRSPISGPISGLI